MLCELLDDSLYSGLTRRHRCDYWKGDICEIFNGRQKHPLGDTDVVRERLMALYATLMAEHEDMKEVFAEITPSIFDKARAWCAARQSGEQAVTEDEQGG